MFHHETAETDGFEQVILQSIRQILAAPSPDRFLAWARAQIPGILGLSDVHLDEVEGRRLATLLGTAIWNAAPQPGNAFRPLPLVAPPADTPCPCGSGLRHRDCCGNPDEVPELSTELIWEFLVDELSESALRDALRLGAVPAPLLARIADRWLEENRPRRAAALLESLFTEPLDGLDARFEPALDLLCDAYDQLDHWRKKLTFLERVCAEGSRPLKAAAWQRLSTIHIDEGDFARAEAAFTAALRSNPDSPGVALLEITLLAAQHKDRLASERARFWLHRFRRLGLTEDGLTAFLARAIQDPQEALVESHADALDPALLDLHQWIAGVADRPLPRYALSPLRPAGAGIPAGQLALFDDSADTARPRLGGDAPMPFESAVLPSRPMVPAGTPVELRVPAPVCRTEAIWRPLFPAGKPQSTHLLLPEDTPLWADRAWLEYLLDHPEAADSLEVLDDLANALYGHPESTLPWIAHALLHPLLERAWSILERTLPPETPRYIPWSSPRNRSALRLLFRRYLCRMEEGQRADAIHTLETLLRLNPQDNHGVRAELMNHYLRAGEDESALALARRFPNDLLADLAYGEVLALYRLGRQDRARLVLTTAVHRLPRIPQYLTRKRIKQPRISPLGITPGGDDQAWLYREAMRDVWAAEPGILAWLKRLTA